MVFLQLRYHLCALFSTMTVTIRVTVDLFLIAWLAAVDSCFSAAVKRKSAASGLSDVVVSFAI